ncbi:winged helix-turn-helix domain-containing protein [Dorea sp. AM10-31]|uniref:winged helix-turn-helix domain-containing protein n=1 Tax=Dorea sp. AM10-31 TaxID=2293098 RepID=UPI002FE536B7
MRPPKGAKCSQLRKKLKVDSRNWNYIRTVRGVGYKFNHSQGSNILWEFFCHICCTFLS